MAHSGIRHHPAYLIQERHFEELRQWMSDRYGWQSRVHKSRWKTVIWGMRNLEEARRACGELTKNGLKEYRITFRGQVVWIE